MNNRIVCPVMLLVGISIGAGVGTLISKSKIDQGKKDFEQLQTQMQTEKTESEETIQKAATEIARKDNELARTKSLLSQITMQLAKAKAELRAVKSRNPEPVLTSPGTGEPEVVITTPSGTATPAVASVEYTVEENDSLWKIAEEQLGNGIRYQEIIDLNDGVTENTVLHKGMKLKLPKQ